MTAFSDYLEEALVDHLLRGQALTAPTNVFLAMFTGSVGDDGSGTANEVTTGVGYDRVTVAAATGNWDAPSGTGTPTTQNTNDIQFGTPSGSWGTISHFAIMDAASGGNILLHGSLAANKVVGGGDPAPKFAAGDLDILLD